MSVRRWVRQGGAMECPREKAQRGRRPVLACCCPGEPMNVRLVRDRHQQAIAAVAIEGLPSCALVGGSVAQQNHMRLTAHVEAHVTETEQNKRVVRRVGGSCSPTGGRVSRRESDRTPISVERLVEQLQSLGVVEGGVVQVHASFSAVGPVVGGPRGLIAALLGAVGADGTIVMPSWPADADAPFDPTRTDAAPDLGVVAQEFWRQPGVRRTVHVQAFSAFGPAAEHILSDALPLPPHIPESPVGRVHQLSGQILLLGVDHDANTTIHLAEVMAGVPYGRPKSCTDVVDGHPLRIEYLENDHCCERFKLVGEWLAEAKAESRGKVGYAPSRLVLAADVVTAVVSRLERHPLLFLHGIGEGCTQCDEARASVTA